MKLADAARKSIVACVSDFAAKGIKPQYGIISVNLPKTISRLKIDEIAEGFRKSMRLNMIFQFWVATQMQAKKLCLTSVFLE